MFYKYPYTDLYNLNLDWLIQAVKEIQDVVGPLDQIVNSVNGLTGDVELTKALLTQILEHVVSRFNGRDGDVTLTAADVNATLIDITWTSDPGETISGISQSELDGMYSSGKRVLIFVNNQSVADRVYFLQYYGGHAQPQEYTPTSALAGVVSFNGQTGNVTATGADLATSGTDGTTIAASLAGKVPVTRTVNNKSLDNNITINGTDIPSRAISGATTVDMALGNLSASKVPNARTVNGKSLQSNIVIYDEDIPTTVDGQTTVEDVLNYQSQQIDKLKWKLAVQDSPNRYTSIPDATWTELFILVRVGNSAEGFSFYYHKTNRDTRLYSGFPSDSAGGYSNCSVLVLQDTNTVEKSVLTWNGVDRLTDGLVTIYYK